MVKTRVSIFPLLQPASPEAQAIFDLFMMIVLISLGIFLVVTGLIAVALWRGRSKQETPDQDFGSHKSEIYWMTGPVLILIWIFVITGKLVLTMNAVPKIQPTDAEHEVELTVIGHQWWWEVKYGDSSIIGANEIHLPRGKKVRVRVESADVIHSFWVPRLARKMDAIPGKTNYIWLEANEEGEYEGRCAEYCGTQHTWMKFKVFVKSPEDYETWRSETEARAKKIAGQAVASAAGDSVSANGDPQAFAAGRSIFESQGCINCHTLEGYSTPSIGPDLTQLSTRAILGAGVLDNSRENLAAWLKDPQKYKPGCKMPDFNLTDEQVDQLVTFLWSR